LGTHVKYFKNGVIEQINFDDEYINKWQLLIYKKLR
jgi:hypothetical protein